jgi:hypothetical protein
VYSSIQAFWQEALPLLPEGLLQKIGSLRYCLIQTSLFDLGIFKKKLKFIHMSFLNSACVTE